MASLLFTLVSTILGAGINAVALGNASLGFIMLRNDDGKECERHDLAQEQLQRARDKCHEDQMKQIDFINKRLREQNKARAYITNVDETMVEYYRVFAKQIKPLPPETQSSDFYHPSESKKMVNYYLLQRAQVLQHMPYINTLNKRR